MIITTIIILIIIGNLTENTYVQIRIYLNNKNDGLPSSISHTDNITYPNQSRFPNNPKNE